MAAQFSRAQRQEGALEIHLLLSRNDIKDPRLLDLAEKALAYKLDVNRAFCKVLFPDTIRPPDITRDEIAAYVTATDSGASITALFQLGWTMDDYEDGITRLLTLFLDPSAVG